MSATPPSPPPASSQWQCSSPDLNCKLRWQLNCKLRMAVFPPGPQLQATMAAQLQAPDGSVLTGTSTASSRRQCSHRDLNCKVATAVFPPGPQPRAPDGSVPTQASTVRIYVSESVWINARWNVQFYARWNVRIYVR